MPEVRPTSPGPAMLAAHLRRRRRYRRNDKKKPETLRDVSRATGISNAYLSQLERGKIAEPGASVLRKLAAYYGDPVSKLWDLVGYPTVGAAPFQGVPGTFMGEPLSEVEIAAMTALLTLMRQGKIKWVG
jgi:transcriptional regulator with XRE-family HTH domain